ncbi:MAG TPA: hypothetical protein VIA18_29940 [Polyangia bacterium]|nr:hypothetical protein [Polyangia bacterium]
MPSAVQAADLSVLDRFASEPSVRELQRAAARVAEVHPERVKSWLGRVRKAALMPTLRVRAGRGNEVWATDSSGRVELTDADTWHFDFEATWSLDRLVFDRNELRTSREAQRLAGRREELLVRVTQLYYERRRLQVDALQTPEAPNAIDRAIEIDELTAVLDGLTDGALSRGKAGP